MNRRPTDDRPYGVQIWPRDEEAFGAGTIGLDLEAPFSDDRLADAVLTINDGLSVFVTARSLDVLDEYGWRIIMAAFGVGRVRH